MGPYCIFIIDEGSLFFGNVVLNTSHTIRLHIKNVGPTPTEIHSHVSVENSVFSVDPEIVTIDSYSTINVSLTFTPRAISVF